MSDQKVRLQGSNDETFNKNSLLNADTQGTYLLFPPRTKKWPVKYYNQGCHVHIYPPIC